MNDRQVFRDSKATVSFTPVGGANVYLVAASAGEQDAAPAIYRRLAAMLDEHDLQIVHERVFGSLGAGKAVLDARAAALKDSANNPLTYIQGQPIAGSNLAGVQIQAIRRGKGKAGEILDSGKAVGRSWTSGGKKFIVLQNMHGSASDSRAAQAHQMFSTAERLLRSHGASYRHVARTWIYLHNILSWYKEFNQARNELYGRWGVMASGDGKTFPPASTGIESANPMGAASTMDVLAVVDQSRPDEPAAEQLSNVRQQDAFRYGSAFSRAAYFTDADSCWMHISGTAAIDQAGKSMFIGDARAQTQVTLDHVEALLAQRDLRLSDIVGGTGFIKQPGDVSIVKDVLDRRGLSNLPAVFVSADVCRDDLLFELDGVAAKRK